MTWVYDSTYEIKEDLTVEQIATLELEHPQALPEGAGPFSLEQFEAAKKAAVLLATAVGPVGGKVNVRMLGHANPNHIQQGGWAKEMITITVTEA